MKKLVIAMAALCVAGAARADFQDGLDAFDQAEYAIAYQEFLEEAEAGHAVAQFNLAVMYSRGIGVAKDYGKAINWYRRATHSGLNLGNRDLANGKIKRFADAIEWLGDKAAAGDVDSQYKLGYHYYNGDGVPQDFGVAAQWFRRAAGQGHAEAQYNLGFIYFNGDGIAPDHAKAVGWFRAAAEQGLADAQYNLGFMYANGSGVARDQVQAIKWFTRAAESGDVDAQYNLGVIFFNGQGVTQDIEDAYFWWQLAAANGREEAAEWRDKAAELLSEDQIEGLRARAREWRPRRSG